jgi:prepilin-type N-terminal cleavage/methylation domain-containing protein
MILRETGFSPKSQSGFTLIEVLFALSLSTIALLGLASMTTMLLQTNASNALTTTAVFLAQDKLEQLNNGVFASTILTAGTYQETAINELGQAGGLFNRSWTITDDTPLTGMKTVVVSVTWNDKFNNRVVSLTRLF